VHHHGRGLARIGERIGLGERIGFGWLSTVGGTQYESLYQIKFLPDSGGTNGNWWVGHNGYWLGYYPGKLFGEGPSNLLASNACEVDWYGEVHDSTPETWTWTDMGSGRFASEGWGNAAYFRDPSYVSLDAAGTWSWPDSDPSVNSIDIPENLPVAVPLAWIFTPIVRRTAQQEAVPSVQATDASFPRLWCERADARVELTVSA
jgi:hypothetical protein